MTVVITQATASDAVAIRSLEGLPAASGRLLDLDLGAQDRCCLVASVEGEVVGYVAAMIHLDEAQILDVVVAPAWRRQGIATRLLTELRDRTRDRGAVAMTLEVREGDVGAQAMYRLLGFTVEGRRPGYYGDGEPALIMWWRD